MESWQPAEWPPKPDPLAGDVDPDDEYDSYFDTEPVTEADGWDLDDPFNYDDRGEPLE